MLVLFKVKLPEALAAVLITGRELKHLPAKVL